MNLAEEHTFLILLAASDLPCSGNMGNTCPPHVQSWSLIVNYDFSEGLATHPAKRNSCVGFVKLEASQNKVGIFFPVRVPQT